MAAGGIGSQLSQPPVALINTANAFTQKYFAPTLADSVFQPSPTWWRMVRLGHDIKGGGALVWPVIATEETTGGAYFGAQLLDTSASDSAQPAELQWKFYYESIVIPYTDYLLNAGVGEVVPLIRAKEEIAMGSLLQKLSRAVYGVAPNNTSDDLDSLVSALASSGSYAGITITSPWRCNGGNGPTTVSAALSIANLQTDYGRATQGNEEPDTVVTTQSIWNEFFVLVQANQRFIYDEETTRAGFKNHLMFNNAVVLHDGFVPSGEVEILTSKYASPCFNPADYFTVEPFVRPTNQRVIVSQIFVMMNLRFLTLRQHSRMVSVT